MTTIIMTTIIMTMLIRTSTEATPADPSRTDAASSALYRLMTWLSPSFPVGSFAFSGGIEWAVEAGDIHDRQSLQQWLGALLSDGTGLSDAIFFVHAYSATSDRDFARLASVAELAQAYVNSRERKLETAAQGRAFIDAVTAAWRVPLLDDALADIGHPVVYPVAVGLVSAAHDVPLGAALHAFLHAVVSNWISAGVRLIPLGQTGGQHALAALERDVVRAGERASAASLDDLGGATFRADIASMRHETQYTRLFRS